MPPKLRFIQLQRRMKGSVKY
jgi:hypothetical protein